MPRKQLIRSPLLPYHVTARSNNKEWFELPMDLMWELTQESLEESLKLQRVEIISFVLMGNHYHMLIRTPDSNLDLFMYEFNKRLALKIQKRTGRINKIFGGRYKWCLIESQHYFMNCYRYVYQNPIRAGIATRCEEYRYSTLNLILKGSDFKIPIFDQYGFKDEYGLRWLNQSIQSDEVDSLKRSLSRSVLTELKCRNNRRPI